jgi:predicted ester cyclase
VTVEENKTLVRREQQELWNHTGELDAAQELFAADQAEAAKQQAAHLRRGFPDVVSTIEDIIAEGDKVVARSGGAGPPTGVSIWALLRAARRCNSWASPSTA